MDKDIISLVIKQMNQLGQLAWIIMSHDKICMAVIHFYYIIYYFINKLLLIYIFITSADAQNQTNRASMQKWQSFIHENDRHRA